MKLENNQEIAAAKAGMDRKTARKYLRARRLPSELAPAPRWRTRADVFKGVWGELGELLKINPGLEAKTLFDYLQRQYPGRFQEGQLRTLQRRVKVWRATEGPVKEVFFAQQHHPGHERDWPHTSGRALRTRQCAADQQPAFFQMGGDLPR